MVSARPFGYWRRADGSASTRPTAGLAAAVGGPMNHDHKVSTSAAPVGGNRACGVRDLRVQGPRPDAGGVAEGRFDEAEAAAHPGVYAATEECLLLALPSLSRRSSPEPHRDHRRRDGRRCYFFVVVVVDLAAVVAVVDGGVAGAAGGAVVVARIGVGTSSTQVWSRLERDRLARGVDVLGGRAEGSTMPVDLGWTTVAVNIPAPLALGYRSACTSRPPSELSSHGP